MKSFSFKKGCLITMFPSIILFLYGCATCYDYDYGHFLISGYRQGGIFKNEREFSYIIANNKELFKTNIIAHSFFIKIKNDFFVSNKELDIKFAKKYSCETIRYGDMNYFGFSYMPTTGILYRIRPIPNSISNEWFQLLFNDSNQLIGYLIKANSVGIGTSPILIGKYNKENPDKVKFYPMPLTKEQVLEIFGKPKKIEKYYQK